MIMLLALPSHNILSQMHQDVAEFAFIVPLLVRLCEALEQIEIVT